jgi:hypothetical protein
LSKGKAIREVFYFCSEVRWDGSPQPSSSRVRSLGGKPSPTRGLEGPARLPFPALIADLGFAVLLRVRTFVAVTLLKLGLSVFGYTVIGVPFSGWATPFGISPFVLRVVFS